ncbi:site-specific integrase [Cryobacterium tagatosivorans]|uniref:Site-specific integrase n=1 Tax=Cryobacterium tagatosivorans TaxID=1259199 RepID=A0A4R8UKH2_9MICO|nr:site-specific integrase [Cryobacterium tagatosivorans]TFB56757.1 site-specific integrase [Cryobacterium tagatosivorans]
MLWQNRKNGEEIAVADRPLPDKEPYLSLPFRHASLKPTANNRLTDDDDDLRVHPADGSVAQCFARPCWGDSSRVRAHAAALVLLVGLLRALPADLPAAVADTATRVHRGLPDVCVRAMTTYTPRNISTARWERIQVFVEDATAIAAPRCAYTQERLLVICGRFVDWAVNEAGLPLRADVLFRPEVVARYVSHPSLNLAATTRRNYRATLMRVSEVLLPDAPATAFKPLSAKDSMRPYTPNEEVRLENWARGQKSPERERNAMVLLSLSMGAGFWAGEILTARHEDFLFDEDGVLATVRGAKARYVPLLAKWEPWLQEAIADLHDGDFVFGDPSRQGSRNVVNEFIQRVGRTAKMPVPQTNRMRATWLVTHLANRTNMRALMRAGGVEKFENLARLLKFVPELDTVEYRRHLRGEANR